MTSKVKRSIGVAVAALLVGCAASPLVDEVETELCEHLAEGPAVAVSAVASGSADGAAVSDDHQRYDIALVDGAGSVSFAADASGELVVGLSQDVPVGVRAPGGAELPQEEVATSGFSCPVMKRRFAVNVAVVGTYTLTFGPSSAQTVSLVLEHGAHGDTHE